MIFIAMCTALFLIYAAAAFCIVFGHLIHPGG